MAAKQEIVTAFSPLVEHSADHSEDYIIEMIDTLGEGIREPGQGLLRRIAEVTPPERAAVHREVALFLKS